MERQNPAGDMPPAAADNNQNNHSSSSRRLWMTGKARSDGANSSSGSQKEVLPGASALDDFIFYQQLAFPLPGRILWLLAAILVVLILAALIVFFLHSKAKTDERMAKSQQRRSKRRRGTLHSLPKESITI
jgi:hypothetical protein